MCCPFPGFQDTCPVCSWLATKQRKHGEQGELFMKVNTEFILAVCIKRGDFEQAGS